MGDLIRRSTLLAALLLAGCQSQPANQAQVQSLGNTCQAYGFKPGTNDFAVCIFQLDQQRIASNRQRRRTVAAAFSGVGAGMQRASRQPPIYSPPVRCTSKPGLNGSVNTVCN